MGLAVASTLFFSNCKKVEVASNETSLSKGTPFEIVANTESTKTTNDGLDTKWAADDALTIFHAVAGTTSYSKNDKFMVSGAGATSFSGTLQDGDLDNTKSYDWYAIYPYNENYSTPANTTWYQQIANKITQNGYGSTAHLAGNKFPLVGQKKNVKAGTTPDISMKQICAVVKVVVTNNSGEALKISSASITSEKVNLAGGYFINFAGDEPVIVDENVEDHEKDKYMFKTVELTVKNGTAIANGSTATLYFGVKPFTAQNETLKLSVNGYEKECVIGVEAVEFQAGHIKTVNFNYDKAPVKLAEGKYAILAKKTSGNYWYMTNDLDTGTTKRFTAVDSGLSELPTALTVSADKLWTVAKSDDEYTISTQDGKQISWASGNSADLAETGKVFTITASTGGSFNVSFAATETETKTLSLNTGSNFFAFYSTLSQITDLYFVPATINNNPTLTLKKTSIPDVAAAGVTGATETGVYTLENAEDDDVIVTYDGTVVTAASVTDGVLTYTVAANASNAREGWVQLALEGQDAKTITVSQKAAGAGEDLKLTFDLTKNPGGWPTDNPTTITECTFTLGNTDYTFALKNVKSNKGYLMLTQTAALGLPAISGKKLKKVEVYNSSSCSTAVKVGISRSHESADYLAGGEAQTWSEQSSKYEYSLTETEAGTMYYLYVTNKNAQITSMTLTYEK